MIIVNTYFWLIFIMMAFSGIAFSLSITFLDVGHGDCIILETENVLVVVDTGGTAGGEKLREVIEKKKRKIDFLFITHPHPDHFYGVSKILDLLANDLIYYNGDAYDDEAFYELLESLKAGSKEMRRVGKGDSFDFSDFRIDIIHPDSQFLEKSSDLNDRSLVMSVIKGERHMLLTADITIEAQSYILDNISHDKLKAEILKFPHHCSKKSFFKDFVDAVSPQIVVVSAGPSVYNYPDEDCIRQVEAMVPLLARTDKEGSISLMW